MRQLLNTLRRTVQAVQDELKVLEGDLGLCESCGDHPPMPFNQRAPRPHVLVTTTRRRVA
jgi:RNA polymerase-binding transcription factor DksA